MKLYRMMSEKEFDNVSKDNVVTLLEFTNLVYEGK